MVIEDEVLSSCEEERKLILEDGCGCASLAHLLLKRGELWLLLYAHVDLGYGLTQHPVEQLLNGSDVPLLTHRDQLLGQCFKVLGCHSAVERRPEPLDCGDVGVTVTAGVAHNEASLTIAAV